jgi:ribosomal protein S8
METFLHNFCRDIKDNKARRDLCSSISICSGILALAGQLAPAGYVPESKIIKRASRLIVFALSFGYSY